MKSIALTCHVRNQIINELIGANEKGRIVDDELYYNIWKRIYNHQFVEHKVQVFNLIRDNILKR